MASDEALRDSLFACRLTMEDSTRDANMWTTWAREAGTEAQVKRPDSTEVYAFAARWNLDPATLYRVMQQARGNWGNLFHFLTSRYPSTDGLTNSDLQERLALLATLSEKDCRDFQRQTLEDHYSARPADDMAVDSSMFAEYLLCPRLSYEPSRPWRHELRKFRDAHTLRISNGRGDGPQKVNDFEVESTLRPWLLSNIIVEDPKDRLGPPLTPAECLELRRGAQDDLDRLYLGFMRVNGVPARFSPVTMKPEIWKEGKWELVDLKKTSNDKQQTSKAPKSGKLVVTTSVDSALYYTQWSAAKWEKDHFTEVDFGYQEPYWNITWPQELPEGLYCLTSGIRAKDGSVPIHAEWFEIKPGKTTKVKLTFREHNNILNKDTGTFEGSQQE
jgi:hypothetical protein